MELSVDTSGRRLVAWTTTVIVIGSLLCTQTVQSLLLRLANAEWNCLIASCNAPAPSIAPRGFLGDVQQRLPQYRDHFREAAERSGVDWRLLAAIGYQESRWNPDAVSPTGVRGLMMLTNETAALLKVDDREDAVQSIHGGSRLIALLLRRLPEQIRGPDRIAMALAAYNQGLGHLLDARTLTEARGGDPNRWTDVRETLPLLADPLWYTQTRYGYARGDEAVDYVARVHRYYEALRSADEGRASENSASRANSKPAPASAKPIPVRRVAARSKMRSCLDLSHIGITPAPRTESKSADSASILCTVEVAASE
jgi:hypothetical protein